MVAPLRLLEHVEIGVQLLLRAEGDAVDALEHRIAAVAAPVGARDRHELEGVWRHLAGMSEMRAAAEVLPVSVPVHAHVLALGDRADELHLVGFVVGLVIADGAVAVPDLGGHRVAPGDDLAHLRLDPLEILRGEGLGAVEVVVEAVLDHRPDGHLGLGPDLLHRAGHDVRAVVADELEHARVVVLRGDDGQRCIVIDGLREIGERAVDARGKGGLGQRFRDLARHLARRGAARRQPGRAVGQGQGHALGHRLSRVSGWGIARTIRAPRRGVKARAGPPPPHPPTPGRRRAGARRPSQPCGSRRIAARRSKPARVPAGRVTSARKASMAGQTRTALSRRGSAPGW